MRVCLQYCYARYTHEYMELDGSEFEKKIYVKKDAALCWRMIFRASIPMRRRVGRRKAGSHRDWDGDDPYQPLSGTG